AKAAAAARPLAAYPGRYVNPAWGEVRVALADGGLTASLNGVPLRLDPAGGDDFTTRTSHYPDRFLAELALAFAPGEPPPSLTLKLDPDVAAERFTRAAGASAD
ncbi:MAG TPA: DUF3471 domain-containing protein, partial [Allosphingosinicella sp.]|nr:DUF3471 domain-containing protein [Allosphingosinicella sp.]